MSEASDWYAGRRAVVTGGLGFVGSNLALELVRLGAEVSVVDACVPGQGGDRGHLDGADRPIEVWVEDLRTAPLARILEGADVVFDLAGQVSHIDSMLHPLADLRHNVEARVALERRR